MTHLFEVDGNFYDALVPKVLSWMNARLSAAAAH